MSHEVKPRNGQMSLDEIAKEMKMSKSAVNMCLCRALRKLRSHGLVFKMQDMADEIERNRKGSVHYET
jgi:predicted transcriptional regulator